MPKNPERHAPRPKAQKYPYLLSGLLRCRCGAHLTPASAWGRGKKPYHYYQCTNADCRRRIKAEEIEQQIISSLSGLGVEADCEAAAALAKKIVREEGEKAGPELERVNEALTAAKIELGRIKGLFLSGVVTPANAGIFNSELDRVNREVQELTGRREALKVRTDPALAVLFDPEEWVKILRTFGSALSLCDGNTDQLRAVIQQVVEKIVDEEDGLRIHLVGGSPNADIGCPQLTQTNLQIERDGAVFVIRLPA